ncbi:MAG: AraC family transcriptional regulator [Spirochaetales bacterium]|nr:AraC family transcriptional regulator [Spirochaetales bacterium]
MRYQVIIVEDEMFTLRELKETINWENLGLNLIGTANNGKAGEVLIKELNPDIVITDIRLPGQDGLEMLEKAPVQGAIILSGHTNFSYTRKAIQLGVFDYLPKPIDDEELERTLLKLTKKLDEENQEIAKFKNEEQMLTLKTEVNNLSISTVIEYIFNNYNKPITLSQMADLVSLTESHLSTVFKAETDMGFLQYLTAVRINKVCELMKNPKLNITEIALSCGFPTPGYFTKIFKRYLGQTPSEYRDKL